MTQTATKEQTSTWNKVIFTGRLGKDPDMSFTPKGNAVTKFSLAVNQGKDSQGQEKPAMWFHVETWKELAEACDKKLARGAQVEIEGRLSQEVWKDKQGQERSTLKITAHTVRLLALPKGKAAATGFIEATESSADDLGDLDDHPF